MESDDKTYMWLMIVAFLGFCIAIGFALAELSELREPITQFSENPYQRS